jgi:hypothetical protein
MLLININNILIIDDNNYRNNYHLFTETEGNREMFHCGPVAEHDVLWTGT